MYLARLYLKNWGPYYGEHRLELQDTVYAVQAAHEKDKDRSNWIGKSWFIGAIRFLLTGVLPESCPNADGWISWGEKSGEVAGVLSDGTEIRRTRTLGKGTQLELRRAGGHVAKQDQAQDEIHDVIGMDDKDLQATSFIAQKQIARLILADPGDRTKIVNAWMELEPLQRAEAWLQEKLNGLLNAERALGLVPTEAESPESLKLEIQEIDKEIAAAEKTRAAALERFSTFSTHLAHAEKAKRFPEVQAQGKRIKTELDALKKNPPKLEQLEARADNLLTDKSVKADRTRQLKELVHDDWDGVCPKTCEACPVAKDVRTIGASMEVELSESESALDKADADLEAAREKLREARHVQNRIKLLESEIERVRTEAAELLESVDFIEAHGDPVDENDLRATFDSADEALTSLKEERAEFDRALKEAERVTKLIETTAATRAKLEASIRTHREAIAVVGKQGAQREIAEGVLSSIKVSANRLLSKAGIDLEIDVRWAREGKGLATHCDTCGAAFPKSQTVKTCPICNTARGPYLVEKLAIVPNDRSGAADDIAGLAFQLAASNWLRKKRTAAWAVTCIDEPFGALDRANARALSSHLHSMIRSSYAFEQGFLVAHDDAVMSALPKRIQIRGTDAGSSLEVV